MAATIEDVKCVICGRTARLPVSPSVHTQRRGGLTLGICVICTWKYPPFRTYSHEDDPDGTLFARFSAEAHSGGKSSADAVSQA